MLGNSVYHNAILLVDDTKRSRECNLFFEPEITRDKIKVASKSEKEWLCSLYGVTTFPTILCFEMLAGQWYYKGSLGQIKKNKINKLYNVWS